MIFPKIIYGFKTKNKHIALTFDDGPHPDYTPRILNILSEKEIKATFFVTGNSAEKYPEIMKRMAAEGHEIGNHSYDHSNLIFKKKNFIRNQIVKTDSIIKEFGVTVDIHFRPPFGRLLFNGLYVLKSLKKTIIMWNIPTLDYRTDKCELIMERIYKKLKPGGIIILHDSGISKKNKKNFDREATLETVSMLCEELPKKGFQFKKISELINNSK